MAKTVDFQACWEVLIACIGNEKIVQLHGKGCIVVMFVSQQLFCKQWLHMISGNDSFFGLPGSNNDINVLERSHLFSELAQGRAPAVNYSINGHDYTMRYYLADSIYPKWSTFVKTIPSPLGDKRKLFAKA